MRRAEKALQRDVREGEVRAIDANEAASAFELPLPGAGKQFEVVGIPLGKPGFYVIELASPRLGRALHGEDKPYFVATSVLVTNLAVHLKHGRESSLVWVTSLDRGKPVANARVSIRDCAGTVYFEGTTDSSGIGLVGDGLPALQAIPDCGDDSGVLFAFARLGDDVAFTQSNWNEGIQPWNFNLQMAERARGSVALHTIFDRPLFRPGETVHMTWVVVDDPIPGGSMILGSGLGRDAGSLTQGEKRAATVAPAYVERTQEAYRAYYAFVPKGTFKTEYTVRLNNPGRFDLPATHVEALYAPEMMGELPNQAVAVKP